MNFARNLVAFGAMLSAIAWPSASAQTSLPEAGGALNYSGVSHSFSGANASASFACGSLSVAGGPSPTLVSASSDCGGDSPQAIFIYAFSIVGPAGIVPVTITSSTTLEAAGDYQAGSSLTVGNETLFGGNCFRGVTEAACGTHAFSGLRSFQANATYVVAMMSVTTGLLGSGFALLDPVFTLDPLFAGRYSLQFSAGVMNGVTTPVPEPGTIALMAAGLLAVAARRRRAQRRG